jgi:hypothetical protein
LTVTSAAGADDSRTWIVSLPLAPAPSETLVPPPLSATTTAGTACV